MENSVMYAFVVVISAVIIDVVLGVVRVFKVNYADFDIRLLPRFLATAVLPYIGGLGVLAVTAQFIGEPFATLFYVAAAATTAKYVAEIKDKVMELFVK